MILEVLEWCLTPASVPARRRGFLSEQIAIRHRARRCRSAWQEHLARTRAFTAERLPEHGREVVVLGSGHLHDVDIGALSERFEHIVLVDAVHPVEVRLRALLSRGRIACMAHDLSGLDRDDPVTAWIKHSHAMTDLVERADLVVSLNLLSQLVVSPVRRWAGRHADQDVLKAARMILDGHMALLGCASKALLITDAEQRFDGASWEDLLLGLELPPSEESWIWQLAPADEAEDGRTEERMVRACTIVRA
jgi:hypothetical protein